MRILFIHQNFPGQFRHIAPSLVREGHEVVAMGIIKRAPSLWEGVRLVPYDTKRGSTPAIHAWVTDIESKVIRGEACFHAARQLRGEGFCPDVVIAHSGWGEPLFIKEVWPQARLGVYSEFFYHADGADVGFDPEFPVRDAALNACRLRMKNVNNLLHFDIADAAISPTHWQALSYPEPFRSKITVCHDGIDTDAVRPDPNAVFQYKGLQFTRSDEVVTFVNRNLEPYRGYHIFMRALPRLLERRPEAHVVIVGGDGTSYGGKPPAGSTWKQLFADEARKQIPLKDWEERVHFTGKLPYDTFLALLQVASVHVYLTYPFVLSWSLLEAMSCGCAIVASDTAPVREAIRDGVNGLLVDFFDQQALLTAITALLENPDERGRLGMHARRDMVKRYDLHTVSLPAQREWIKSLSP
ncbi:MAG: glycosyltransferase family 4 protein [Chlorobium phaeovibrioides]|nr:glycosyltransferase family 4 protein [Chlorobium phaeovibrioides]